MTRQKPVGKPSKRLTAAAKRGAGIDKDAVIDKKAFLEDGTLVGQVTTVRGNKITVIAHGPGPPKASKRKPKPAPYKAEADEEEEDDSPPPTRPLKRSN